jgi:hypothetical protein
LAVTVSPALDLLVHFLETAANPIVIAVAGVMPFVWSHPVAVRVATVSVAALLGMLEAIATGEMGWGLMLVTVGAMAGALVAEIVLTIAVPIAFVGLGSVRSILLWVRGLR